MEREKGWAEKNRKNDSVPCSPGGVTHNAIGTPDKEEEENRGENYFFLNSHVPLIWKDLNSKLFLVCVGRTEISF